MTTSQLGHTDSLSGEASKYLELSSLLRRKIEAGEYRPGDQIPTEQELGKNYDVSRSTIRQAIARLEKQGYLIRRRGAGTFVGDIGSRGVPISPLKKLGFLLVDSPIAKYHWGMRTTQAAHQYLSRQNIDLAISHLETMELFKGRAPGVMRGETQAVLLDGHVSNLHCMLLEEAKLPYLVLGNLQLEPCFPQARYAFDRMIARGVRYLHALRPNQPVALFVEPLKLYLTHEIYESYAQAVQSLPQRHPILQTTEDARADLSLGNLLDAYAGPISLIVTDMQWTRAFSEYRRRGLSPVEYPVLMLGDTQLLRPEERAPCHVLPMSGDHLVYETLPRFIEAFNAGRTEQIRIEIDNETIEPPTAEALG